MHIRSAHRHTLRNKVGAAIFDLPRYIPSFISANGWLKARNRTDKITVGAGGLGISCSGEFSSDLHGCHVFPRLGRQLMRAALKQWPILLDDAPFTNSRPPQVTFVIPHRGIDRLPQLIATIHSIRAQRGIDVECIVVEQDQDTIISGLPDGVRHIHLPDPSGSMDWKKSWAFNTGVRESRADIIVCHDGDILVPADYGRQILHHLEADCDVVHLHRFLFCLDEHTTTGLLQSNRATLDAIPERVRQNWQGGTLAIRKSAYHQIGGFDERF
ncbi:MAG: glycosyltransferase, partial [Planctomycetaceae bacterium]